MNNMMASEGDGVTNESMAHYVKEMCQIPNNMVGLIIGKGGEQILRIQRTTGCRVQLASNNCELPERPCTLTGPAPSVLKAKEIIDQILEKGKIQKLYASAPTYTATQNAIELLIPSNFVGALIGKGGINIKNMQKVSGALMKFSPPDDKDASAHLQTLNISGRVHEIETARQLVLNMLAQNQIHEDPGNNLERATEVHDKETSEANIATKDKGMNLVTKNYDPSTHTAEIQFFVPSNKCGLIIGKGGDTIRSICRSTGAQVLVGQSREPNTQRVVTIKGYPVQVEHAKQLIIEYISAPVEKPQKWNYYVSSPPSVVPFQQNYEQPVILANVGSMYQQMPNYAGMYFSSDPNKVTDASPAYSQWGYVQSSAQPINQMDIQTIPHYQINNPPYSYMPVSTPKSDTPGPSEDQENGQLQKLQQMQVCDMNSNISTPSIMPPTPALPGSNGFSSTSQSPSPGEAASPSAIASFPQPTAIPHLSISGYQTPGYPQSHPSHMIPGHLVYTPAGYSYIPSNYYSAQPLYTMPIPQ